MTGANKPTLFSDIPFSFTLSVSCPLYLMFQTTIYTNDKMKLQILQEIKLEQKRPKTKSSNAFLILS